MTLTHHYSFTRIFRWVKTWDAGEPTQAENPRAPTLEELNIPETGSWSIYMRAFPAGWIFFILVVDIGLFVSTEKTISNNIVGPGEGQWTFGQTLALLVVIFPAMDVWRQTREMLNNRRVRKLASRSRDAGTDANEED